jgi:hypothetical protein
MGSSALSRGESAGLPIFLAVTKMGKPSLPLHGRDELPILQGALGDMIGRVGA